MKKPTVLVVYLTGTERHQWPCPDLVETLLHMSHDPRFDVTIWPIRDLRPHEFARNTSIIRAREDRFDWLISFDNDNAPWFNPLDILQAAGKDQHVIGATSGAIYHDFTNPESTAGFALYPDPKTPGASSGIFREVPDVGGACLMVHRKVWETIPKGPYFRWMHADNEFLSRNLSEDVYFCRLVTQHGLRVWTHNQLIRHYRSMDITSLTATFGPVHYEGEK